MDSSFSSSGQNIDSDRSSGMRIISMTLPQVCSRRDPVPMIVSRVYPTPLGLIT